MSPLEQTIKEYFDQYGAILVGMHQDLHGQQEVVDRKLTNSEKRITDLSGQFDARSGEILSGMSKAIQAQQESADRRQAESEGRIKELVGQFDARSAKAVSDIEKMHDQLHTGMVNHYKITEASLKEYRATNAKQQEIFEQRRTELLAMHQQVINNLREINQKTEAHQLREAAFNKRLRQILIGIVAIASAGILAAVILWKP